MAWHLNKIATSAVIGLLILAGIALYPSDGNAKTCPPSITIDQPITTHNRHGVSFDTIHFSRHQGYVLAVPIGYFKGWDDFGPIEGVGLGVPNSTPPEHDWRTFGFVFWMPSGRHPERAFANHPFRRMCEPGRPKPTENEYLVTVTMEKSRDRGDGLTGVQRLQQIKLDARSRSGKAYGLERFSRVRNGKLYESFQLEDSSQYHVLIQCYPLNPPSGICSLRVWIVEKEVQGELWFPREGLHQWRDILTKFEALFEQFHLNAQNLVGD